MSVYNIEITARVLRFVCTLNGFPVVEEFQEGHFFQAPPVNHLLVSGENSLVVSFVPPLGVQEKTDDDAPMWEIKVKKYAADEFSGSEGGEVIAVFTPKDLLPLEQGGSSTGGVSGKLLFNADGHDFQSPLLVGVVLEDEEAIRNYGRNLLSLVEKEEIDSLVKAFAPKHKDFESAYFETPGVSKEEFSNYLSSMFFPGEPATKIALEMIGVKPWCEGRVWEVFILPNSPLLTTNGNDELPPLSIRVFVGEVDGELKVIR